MDVDEQRSDSTSWKISKGEVTVRIDQIKSTLRYDIDVVVPNGCYSAGDVSEAPVRSRNAVLNVVVEYKPGFCTQAVKTLQFDGQIDADAKQIDRVEVNIHDRRKGTVNEVSLKL